MFKKQYPLSHKIIHDSTYIDDIIDCCKNKQDAIERAEEICLILKKGNFHIKGWILSGGITLDENGRSTSNNEDSDADVEITCDKNDVEKVLGMKWMPVEDYFTFEVCIKFGKRRYNEELPSVLTKRMLVSFLNGIYDPMGLVNPVISSGKILIRKIWGHEPKLDWDTALPEHLYMECLAFMKNMLALNKILVRKCIRPLNAIANPVLITFSDASKQIFGACCFLQWKLDDGSHACSLVLAKSRVAPLKVITIVRLELLAAVMATRMRKYIVKEGRIQIDRFIHIVDSEIVRTMIQKESYGFNTFTATKVGEIQENSNPDEWYWINGQLNVADIITRDANPQDLGQGTAWQNGPSFSKLKIDGWPISQTCHTINLPEIHETCLHASGGTCETPLIEITRFSKYLRLMFTTARILSLKGSTKPSLILIGKEVTGEKFEEAFKFWIKECQREIGEDLQKAIERKGKLRKLSPILGDDNIYVVGGRAIRWNETSYNKQLVPILPKNHMFSLLFSRYIHERAHLGVNSDVAKIRSFVWLLIRVLMIMKAITLTV